MGLVSIGEFAQRSMLSAKALRRYDELGLLRPAQVDRDSGYRWYETGQIEQARLVAALRQIDMPLAQIKQVLALAPKDAADQVAAFWAEAEAAHAARSQLAGYLVDRLKGKRTVMYEVATRQLPERSLLCLLRRVDGDAGAWALGKEFVALMQARPLPRLPGRAGAAFVIYHGEVTADSDGPVEWCRPIPADQAGELAARFPELTLRTEHAHQEAFVHLGDTQATPPSWQLVSETLHSWGVEHHHQPDDLAPRVTFLATPPRTADSRPDCDFAVPFR